MSSMIVAADLDLMMIEISIQELVVPRVSYFDSALLKKTIVMFRLLDKDWTSIYPQRTDYHIYRGSNSDKEPFNGGVSLLFPIPQSSLEFQMKNVDLQLHVRKELSKYFELESCEIIGIACIDVSDLFNGIINGIKKRKDENISNSREPVSKSSKNTYQLLKEDGSESGANVTVYLRLTHLGQTIISEIEVPDDPKLLFYAREETSDNLPYQFREINEEELTSGCWGSGTLIPPKKAEKTICCCDSKDRKNLNDNGLYSNIKDLTDSKDSTKDTKTTINQSKKKMKKNDREVGKNGTKDESKIDNNYGAEGKFDGGIKQGNEEEDGKGKEKGMGKEKRKGNVKGKGNGETGEIVEVEKEEVEKKGIVDDEGQVSCLVKPDLCGREGTCNKKDKKGKFGKCGRPDGESGNPKSCGEQRKCARRKMAAGSATVGIVDKKIPPCPPPTPIRTSNICPCPILGIRNLQDKNPWSMIRCDTVTSPCAKCATDRNYGAMSRPELNHCRNYETRRYNLYEIQNTDTTSCRNMHIGW